MVIETASAADGSMESDAAAGAADSARGTAVASAAGRATGGGASGTSDGGAGAASFLDFLPPFSFGAGRPKEMMSFRAEVFAALRAISAPA